VANIENFLLMYNTVFKYDLCRYWQILEEKGFDPVIGSRIGGDEEGIRRGL
jgi:hypothetical protein